MTISVLERTLSDRIVMLESALRQIATAPSWLALSYTEERSARDRVRLEGRLEELRVCLRLVEKLKIDKVDNFISDRWGAQERVDWPNSTFGGADVLS